MEVAGSGKSSGEVCGQRDHSLGLVPAIAGPHAMEKASRIFRALGETSRLRLVARLAQREMCVTEIAEAEQEDLSAISQRLRVLRAEHIVVRRRRGKHINYALADHHMTDLIENVLAHASEPEPVDPERTI